MKNKKICRIILIIIIVIVGMLIELKNYYYNNDVEYENISNEIIENQIQEMKEDSFIEENIINSILENDDVTKIQDDKTISQKNIVENCEKEQLFEIQEPIVKSVQEISISKDEKKENLVIENPIVEEETTIVKQNTDIAKESQIQEIITEEYIFNNEMTQRIINIINSNPSEFMLQDGYSVEVDNSIVNLTNQFTFTEERVMNKILYKAGTIRVYAQDYYLGGQYLFTECYIM